MKVKRTNIERLVIGLNNLEKSLIPYSQKYLDSNGIQVVKGYLMNAIFDKEDEMAINDKAEMDNMLKYVSTRMNKAADKMVEACEKANKAKVIKDEAVYKAQLKKYVKHRMSYLWYKHLLENNLKAIDLQVEKEVVDNG